MDQFINWCGFFGAWLLVAGPLMQGARELREEDIERDDLLRAKESVEPPESISPWWWLIPPVGYWKQRKKSREYQGAVAAAMDPGMLETFMRMREKANAWLIVSLGATLIAAKETWELVEIYEWPESTFWWLSALMGLIAVGNTVAGARRWQGFFEYGPGSRAAAAEEDPPQSSS